MKQQEKEEKKSQITLFNKIKKHSIVDYF